MVLSDTLYASGLDLCVQVKMCSPVGREIHTTEVKKTLISVEKTLEIPIEIPPGLIGGP